MRVSDTHVIMCPPLNFTVAEQAALSLRMGCKLEYTAPSPGCVQEACADCGRDIWVAPSSVAHRQEHADTKMVCLACGVAEAGDEVDFSDLPVAGTD
jgi:hypothetical protein